MKRIIEKEGPEGAMRKLDQITGNTKQLEIKEYDDIEKSRTFSRGMY